jgi:hypothetical protein
MANDGSAAAERAVARAARRLRLRSGVRGLALGVQVAAWFAVALVAVGKLAAVPLPLLVPVVGLAGTAIVGLAVAGGVARGVPDRRGLALLVDRLGRTEELVVTALHVRDSDDPNRDAILGRVAATAVPPARALLPIAVPRHLRWLPVPVLAVVLAAWLVPSLVGPWFDAASPVADEGARLERRLDEMEAAPEALLPEPLEREIAALADDLEGNELTPEEARQELADLQQKLDAFRRELEPSADLLKDLEDAARQLDEASTDALSDALQAGDLDAAAGAAQDLSRSLSEATPEERQRASDALNAAGEQLAKSSDPSLRQAGEAMQQAAGQMAPGGDRTPADARSTDPGQGGEGLTPQEAEALADQLRQAKELGKKLQQDKAALQRSQEIAGALEGSRQRLGGQPGVAGGQSSSEGDPGTPASGEGQGGGDQPGAGGPEGGAQAGASASSGFSPDGHTWEDQGGYTSAGKAQEADRFDARRAGQQIDDFRKLYGAQRLDGADALLAGVDGKNDPTGQVDQLPMRLTSGVERATTPSVDLPATYRAEATEAIEAERVPPAYEQAVKQYFDQMD